MTNETEQASPPSQTPTSTDETDGARTAAAGPTRIRAPSTARTSGTAFFAIPAVKFFTIAFLASLLMIPMIAVWILASEREQRRDTVVESISRDWGGAQVIQGPILVVPFVRSVSETINNTIRTTERCETAVFLPETYTATANLKTEIRSVSIFSTPVYSAAVNATGEFPKIDESAFGSGVRTILWDQAAVVMLMSDTRALEDMSMVLGRGSVDVEPGGGPARVPDYGPSAVHALVPTSPLGAGPIARTGFAFNVDFRVRGSTSINIAPVGRVTTVSIASDWIHPSYIGRMLPSEREASETGTSAIWRVPYLGRTTKQSWITDELRTDDRDLVGVTLRDRADFYTLVDRALKYGIMFVAAVFGIVFMLEVLSRKRIHVVQYTLVGLIVIFFYVLLLALAEHVSFAIAYAAASVATGGVVAAFVGSALASRGRGLVAALGIGSLFALLFLILTLEDVALLAGALVGFAALTLVLFATRRVNWSGEPAAEETPELARN